MIPYCMGRDSMYGKGQYDIIVEYDMTCCDKPCSFMISSEHMLYALLPLGTDARVVDIALLHPPQRDD